MKRFLAHGAVFALVVQVLTVGFLVAPKFQPEASAAPTIQLTKTAPRSVLAGAEATYRLTVTNPGDTVEFNVSFSDVLPNEARFVAGAGVTPRARNSPGWGKPQTPHTRFSRCESVCLVPQ